jgi:amino acid transporter
MGSAIIAFIYSNWEDILISFFVGTLFYFLGRKKLSDLLGSINISATDRLIIIILVLGFVAVMYVLVTDISRRLLEI